MLPCFFEMSNQKLKTFPIGQNDTDKCNKDVSFNKYFEFYASVKYIFLITLRAWGEGG